MKVNYHKIMLSEIEEITRRNERPRLLLHSCCAPCSSYVLEFLSEYFENSVFFFNPNIFPLEEYEKRLEEQIRLIEDMGLTYKVIGRDHESELFYSTVKGYEELGEGTERCFRCYDLRLRKAAEYGAENSFDYFTSTLTISPLKNVNKINEIGIGLEKEFDIRYLQSDFKKNNGYKRSTELSKEHGLYRQNYCGCVFSKKESESRKVNKLT